MATPTYWQQRAIDETGGSTTNTVFGVAFAYGTSGGTFTAAFGAFVTPATDYPPSAPILEAAINQLASVGADGSKVTGPIGGPFEIEMVGGNSGQVVPVPVFDGSQLEPVQEIQIEALELGSQTSYSEIASVAWDNNSDALSDKHRFLLVKRDLIDYRLGKAVDEVDVQTGQQNQQQRKGSQRFAQLQQLRGLVDNEIAIEVDKQTAAKKRTFGGVIQKKTFNGLPFGVLAPGCTPWPE